MIFSYRIIIIYKMAEITFIYDGIQETIPCNNDDKMKDIINKFLIKVRKKEYNNIINHRITP